MDNLNESCAVSESEDAAFRSERNAGMWEAIDRNREHMKCPDFDDIMEETDQEKRLRQPPLCKAAKGDVIHIAADSCGAVKNALYSDLLDIRRSERSYDREKPMTQSQLAFLLWSTQGVQEIRGSNYATLRPVPSGGARHAFEMYFIARNIEGLEKGVYHYLPLEHVGDRQVAVEFLGELPDMDEAVTAMLAGQKWAANAPAVMFLSCVAYRAEWRYSALAHRVALIDAGHVGQNFMLSASALGMGSCCIAAYDQALCDGKLGLDGIGEYTVYAFTAGMRNA